MSKRNRKRRQPSVPREIGTKAEQFGPNGVLALQERLRVSKIIERDERASNHEKLMAEERSAQAEFQRLYRERDPFWGYIPRTADKPAKLDLLRLEIINPQDPKSKRRYRVVGPEDPDHPLRKAYEKRKIDQGAYNAGNTYRVLWETAYIRVAAGRDSTQAMMVNGSGKGFEPAKTVGDHVAAKKALAMLHLDIGAESAQIIEKFCGLGLDMAQAVHSTVPCDKSGVLHRLKEALRALNRALGNESWQKKSA